MNYNLSRHPNTYEFDRESFGFRVNSKIYDKREYSCITDSFRIIDSKKIDKYINTLDIIENNKSNKNEKYYDYMVNAPLYLDGTINLYMPNQNFIPLVSKLVMRKLIINYLKKQKDVKMVNTLTNEKQYKTTFIIKNGDVFKKLNSYLYDLQFNYSNYERFLNDNLNKIGKSNYLLQSTKNYKIDKKHPIYFSNLADGLDVYEAHQAYLNLLARIYYMHKRIELMEQKKNKRFKAVTIWTI